MRINDRSQGNASPLHSFGTEHLATSDSKANAERSDTLSLHEDGQISQAPRVPSEKPYPEVAEVVGGGERCSAETANQGGAAGEGHVEDGATALHPVVAKLDHQGNVMKTHGVASNPQIMRAHQTGSITATDHKTVHGAEKCPVTTAPSSAGSTMPAQKIEKAQKPVRAGQEGFIRESNAAHSEELRRRAQKAVVSTEGTPVIFVGDSTQEDSEQARLAKVAGDAAKPKMPAPVNLGPSHPAVYFGGRQRPVTAR